MDPRNNYLDVELKCVQCATVIGWLPNYRGANVLAYCPGCQYWRKQAAQFPQPIIERQSARRGDPYAHLRDEDVHRRRVARGEFEGQTLSQEDVQPKIDALFKGIEDGLEGKPMSKEEMAKEAKELDAGFRELGLEPGVDIAFKITGRDE